MKKQTKGNNIGGSYGGVPNGNMDYTNSQLGKTKSSQTMKNIGKIKREAQKSRSDNTPNPSQS